MSQATNTSGTTQTTITFLDDSSASFPNSSSSSVHSNGAVSNGGNRDVPTSTTSSTNKIFIYKNLREVEFGSSLTSEDICLSLCRQLKVLPTTRLLFGLRVLNSENEWAAPSLCLRRGVRYCFRMRIKIPNMDTQLRNLDKEAYEYLYWQIRYDIVNEKIPEIRNPEKKDNVMGFAVMDMSIDLDARSSATERLENNYKREVIENIESNYKHYLPQTLLKKHKYFVKSKICAKFKNVRENKIGFTEFKYYYISGVCKLATNYLTEVYVAFVNYIPNDDLLSLRTPTVSGECGTRVFVKLDTYDKIEPGLKISREKVKWTLLAKVEDIFAICIEDHVCACLEVIGLPQSYRMQFESRAELESFITYIGSYSRLTAKWMTDLCDNFPTPSLQELKSLRCHGPIGGAFSFAKLRANPKKGASFIFRQCEKEYDVYYIDKCTQTSLKSRLGENIITSKITRECDKWLLQSNEGLKAFKTLKDLKNSVSAQVDWIHPSAYDKAPFLLICLPKNQQPKKIETVLSEEELRKRKVQIFDRTLDLRWYESTERICENGKIMTVRGDWIQNSVCKDVSVMLKVFSTESDSKEFTNLASFCSKIFAAQFLKLYGLTLTTPYTMVMEYSPYGPLDEFLRSHKDEISLKMLINMVYELARGVMYLNDNTLHHGFIRCSNLFVTKFDPEDDCIVVKIGDPGIHRSYSYADLPWIPHRHYIDIKGVCRDSSLDYWSFATTVWEIFAYGKCILKELDCVGKLSKVAEKLQRNLSQTGGILPKPSEWCPEEIYFIMLDGWSLDGDSSFGNSKVFEKIRAIKSSSYGRIDPKGAAGRDIDNGNRENEDQKKFFTFKRLFIDTQWVIPLSVGKVIVNKKLDEGHYGDVYLGELCYDDPDKEPEEVAVKVLKPENTASGKDLSREIKIMESLNHPNVVKIKYSVNRPFSIIMEYLSEGSFLVYLKHQKHNLTDERLLHFANDIARGMDYLTGKKIIHRDLAARNILVDKDHVKISDFGLAQLMNEDGYYWVQTLQELPIAWYAPEAIAHEKYSLKSDVWSYGVTLFEMFSRGDSPDLEPGKPLTPEQLLQRLQKGERLRKPVSCPQVIYDKLMLPCWHADPKARPTFAELLDSIRSIMYEWEVY